MRVLSIIAAAIFLVACGPLDPELAAQRCEDRARKAQAPIGKVTLGVNSNTGAFGRAQVGVTSDFLRGRDPQQVYDECVINLTGAMPIRPPVLRNR